MVLEAHAEALGDIRMAVRDVCKKYDGAYWRGLDREGAYPEAFVRELTELGWLSALIPEQYGGGGMSVTEASVVLEEINYSGGDSAACHAQMYIMGTILRHGSDAQKARYLPSIASGELRLQAFAVTEPDARVRDDAHRDDGGSQGRPVRRERTEDVHLTGGAVRPDAAAGAHDTLRRVEQQDRGVVRLRGRYA